MNFSTKITKVAPIQTHEKKQLNTTLISMRSIVYHQADRIKYTHLWCDDIRRIYAAMIYTLKRDDMPSLSA